VNLSDEQDATLAAGGWVRPEAAVGKLCLPIIEGKNTL